jgi:hypothetical protein
LQDEKQIKTQLIPTEAPLTRNILILASALLVSLLLIVAGCDKEKIVETEYVEQTEYVQLPPDTVLQVDTIVVNDSVTVQQTDTLYLYDTIETVNTVYDTSYVYDTVTVTIDHYDTVTVTVTEIDTVVTYQCEPNEYLAIEAMQQYANPLVIDLIYSEFGYNDGWVFYLSTGQSDVTVQSSTVYDIYGYIDYWTPDWSAYYALEYYWRMTYVGGDPADPNNWDISEPSTSYGGDIQPGVKMTPADKLSSRKIR